MLRAKRKALNDNWSFWIWFFGPNMAVPWRKLYFSKKLCWNPYFYSGFWVRTCLAAKLSKKGRLWTPTKKGKIWLETESSFFGSFVLLLFFLFSLFCYLFFKGQVRWPEGPPHLALNPPYFYVLFSLLFVCFFSFPFFAFTSTLSLFGGFPVFLFQIPFSYLCFFLILSCVSYSTWMFLSFKKTS